MGQAGGRAGTGLKPNVAGLLCYAFLWVGGLVFFALEKDDKFVRFHAIQSVLVFGAVNGIFLILFWIPVIGWIFSWLLFALSIVLWIMLVLKAYRGEKFKLPIAGKIAARQA